MKKGTSSPLDCCLGWAARRCGRSQEVWFPGTPIIWLHPSARVLLPSFLQGCHSGLVNPSAENFHLWLLKSSPDSHMATKTPHPDFTHSSRPRFPITPVHSPSTLPLDPHHAPDAPGSPHHRAMLHTGLPCTWTALP